MNTTLGEIRVGPWIALLFDVVPGTVVPGSPVKFSWQLISHMEGNPGNLTAKIFVNGIQIYTNPIPIACKLSDGLSYIGGEDNFVQLSPSQPGAVFLYQFGPVTLQLEVTCSNAGFGPFAAESTFSVIPEAVDQSWWQWVNPPGTADWNTPYIISANFLNKSQFTQMSCSLVLTELDDANGQTTNRTGGSGNLTFGPVGINGTFFVTFPTIIQNWVWVIPGCIIIGDLERMFNYSVTLSLRDAYGNEYQPVKSNTVNVFVSVSNDKRNAVIVGFTATSVAVYMTALEIALLAGIITAAGAPAATAAAAAATALSATSYAIAIDPIKPNANYRSVHEQLSPSVPKAFAKVAKNPLIEAMQLCTSILLNADSLAQTYGRLQGARLAKNSNGIEIQTKAYQHYEKKLNGDLKKLKKTVEAAAGFFESKFGKLKGTIAGVIHLWTMQGLPPLFYKELTDMELLKESQENIEGFLKAVPLPDLSNSIHSQLEIVALHAALVAQLIHEQTLKTLTNTNE